MNKIKIGLVGLGWVGLNRHLPALLRNKNFELIGVHDKHGERSAAVAKKYKILSSSGSKVSEISWLDSVDAVSVATSPMTHYKIVSELLAQNKHVIVEKPFCLEVDEGRQLSELAKEKEKILCVVHNFQFSSAFLKMQRDMSSGKFGNIHSIIGMQFGNPLRRLPSWYQQLPLGLFYDESPHLLYLLKRLAPAPLSLNNTNHVRSTVGNTTPASIDAFYSCKSKIGYIPVSLHMRFEAPLSEWYIILMGTEYIGVVDIFRNIYTCLKNDGKHGSAQILNTSMTATLQHWLQFITQGVLHVVGLLDYGNAIVFSRFANAICTGGNDNFIDAENAQSVLEMQHAIIKHIKSKH